MGRINDDIYVNGTLSAATLTIPTASLVNSQVSPSADIDASKLEHQYAFTYAQESATLASDEARVIHAVYGVNGTIIGIDAGSVVACTGTDKVEIDLLKDGVSVLTAKITLDSSNVAYTPEAGSIDTATLEDGDVLEVSIDATAGDGVLAKGVYVTVIIREDAAST